MITTQTDFSKYKDTHMLIHTLAYSHTLTDICMHTNMCFKFISVYVNVPTTMKGSRCDPVWKVIGLILISAAFYACTTECVWKCSCIFEGNLASKSFCHFECVAAKIDGPIMVNIVSICECKGGTNVSSI